MVEWALHRRWLGFGVKTGGQLGIGGYESVTAFMINIRDGSTFDLQISSARWGLGLGGSGGVVAVIGFGIVVPDEWHRRSLDDWGVNIALTEKLVSKSALEALAFSKRFHDAYKTNKALRAGYAGQVVKDVQFFETIRNSLHTLFAGLEAYKKAGIVVIDLPFLGAGVELSAFVTKGTIYVSNASGYSGSGY